MLLIIFIIWIMFAITKGTLLMQSEQRAYEISILNITGPVWCYCNTCPENIKYCKAENGSCYKQRITDDFYLYGCWDENEAVEKCSPIPNTYLDKFGYTVGPRVFCCNVHWCTVKPHEIIDFSLNLIDLAEENMKHKLRCFCSSCVGDKVCMTDGICYKNSQNRLHFDYGCTSERLERCGGHFSLQIFNNFLNPSYQCCQGLGPKLCNFYPLSKELYQVYPALRIKSIRLERLNINDTIANYRMEFRNAILGEMSVTYKSMLSDQPKIATISPTGNIEIKFNLNRLYEIELHPLLHDFSLYELNQTFYFTRISNYIATWFPSSLYYDYKIPTVVICNKCIEETNNYNCSQCESFTEPDTNPIWLTL